MNGSFCGRLAFMTNSSDALRIDRWLFYCRFYKSRSMATAAVSGGQCYEEDPGIVLEREALTQALRQDRMLMPRTKGRPDKHTRRQLIRRNKG